MNMDMNFTEKQVDRLSNLPESVLIRILSFLPARDAAKTVVIPPFRQLWMNIDTLDFDDYHLYGEDRDIDDEIQLHNIYQNFTRFVRHFIMLHKTPTIHKFKLTFREALSLCDTYHDPGYVNEIEKLVREVRMWVKFALSRAVKVLDLSYGVFYGGCMEENVTLPCCIWTSPSLVQLKLYGFNEGCLEKVPVRMGSLRVLALNRVNFSDDAITKVINNCPLLEDVSITDCFELKCLSFTNPNVKRLQLLMEDDNVGHYWYLSVDCPNVTSFEYSGYGNCLKVINISSVKVATLDIQFGICIEFIRFVELKRFLESFQHVEVLKLGQEGFTVLIYHVVQNHPFLCNKWKCLEFNTTFNGKHISGICSLLRQSSYLEELVINVRDPLLSSVFFPEEIGWELYDSGDVWENDWSSDFLMPNLKTVAMHGLLRGSVSAQIELVKIILKNTPVLDKVCIYTKGDSLPEEKYPLPSSRVFEISKKMLSFPKASKQATVFLL